jgi:ABC transporter substrate binding protein
MQRRDFIKAIISSAAAAWPFATPAQQLAMPMIGFLHTGSPGPYQHLVAAFHQGLKETGYVDGQNVIIEFRWAEGHYDRLPAMVADLVRRKANIIAAVTTPAALAAEASKTTIPIIFDTAGDPVRLGLVASLNRPGRNITVCGLVGFRIGRKTIRAAPRSDTDSRGYWAAREPERSENEGTGKGYAGGGARAGIADPYFECEFGGRTQRRVCKVNRASSKRPHCRDWRAL